MEIMLIAFLIAFSFILVFCKIAIPCILLGWLLSYLNLSPEWMTRLLLLLSVLMGVIGSILLHPQGEVVRVLTFAPPIALALFIGRWIGQKSRSSWSRW